MYVILSPPSLQKYPQILWFCVLFDTQTYTGRMLVLEQTAIHISVYKSTVHTLDSLVSHFDVFVSILRKECVSLGDRLGAQHRLSSSLPSLYIFDIYLDKSKFQNIYANFFSHGLFFCSRVIFC